MNRGPDKIIVSSTCVALAPRSGEDAGGVVLVMYIQQRLTKVRLTGRAGKKFLPGDIPTSANWRIAGKSAEDIVVAETSPDKTGMAHKKQRRAERQVA